jgi:UrcA family protein
MLHRTILVKGPPVIRPVLLALALAATPAAAGEIQLRSERVAVADLDLATEAGVARLDARLERAAARACEKPGLVTGWDRMLVADCRARALASVAPQRADAISAARSQHRLAGTDPETAARN